MPFAMTTDHAGIFYRVRGAGEPLVLLSGQANTHHWWDNVHADFDGAHRTVVLDYLGTGESDKPRGAEYSTRRFAADVIAVLDDLGIARAHVYGTSMGGKVAQWVAADHPDRVGALVLGCTSPGGDAAIPADPAVLRPLAQSADVARQALVELMYSPEWIRRNPGPYVTLGDSMPDHARRAHRLASSGHDATSVLGGITAPTLVLHGTDDLFTPAENAAVIAHRIPAARLHHIEGARHAYFEECQDSASESVLRFLAAHPLR